MTITLNATPYDLFSQEKDVVTLRDFSNDKGIVAYKRTLPKRTKDFPGMEKTEVKHTVEDAVLGTIGIITVSTSIRADQAAAVRTAIKATAAGILADASYENLIQDQRLPQG